MNILVVGGTGATGRLLVRELLSRGCKVTIVARSPETADAYFPDKKNLTVVRGAVLEMDAGELAALVEGIDAVGSCLGHRLTLKGIFGKPRKLVAGTLRKLCEAVKENARKQPVKVVLMGSTGVRNGDAQEKWSRGEGAVLALLRLLLPPQRDNELAAEYLRSGIGKDDASVEWAVVRPDTLVDEAAASDYRVFESPIRSPVFDAGATSRMNVARFMSELLADGSKWNEWKGKMPAVYNRSSCKP